jgi:glycosyltransferase involved in cell wall biosynthesis
VKPVATVVIPTRNRGQRVGRAVASAQAQTVSDIEIIVVDDASKDETATVLDAIAAADSRVRVVRNAEPGGAAAARNRGLDEAGSGFVAFLDDDDRWLPHKLERQLALVRLRPELVLVGCHHRMMAGNGVPGPEFRGPAEFTADDLRWANVLGSASNVVVAAQRLRQQVRFATEFPANEDWDFYLSCNRRGQAAIVHEVLCEYTVHEGPERLTNQLANRIAGYELVVARNRDTMTPACIAYHQARIAVQARTSKTQKLLRLLPNLLRTSPPVVLRALVAESIEARVGRLTGDPARPMRHLQRLVASTRG